MLNYRLFHRYVIWVTLSQWYYIDGLVQERRNSSGLAVEIFLSLTHRYDLSALQTTFFNSGSKTDENYEIIKWK